MAGPWPEGGGKTARDAKNHAVFVPEKDNDREEKALKSCKY
jgi:hypothetical protein